MQLRLMPEGVELHSNVETKAMNTPCNQLSAQGGTQPEDTLALLPVLSSAPSR